MLRYLKPLRWHVVGAALLPSVYLPAMVLGPAGYIGLVLVWGVLSLRAGRTAVVAGASVARASFAGPLLLAVSSASCFVLFIIPAVLRGWASSPIQAFGGALWFSVSPSLLLYPVAQGLAALGAYRTKDRGRPERERQPSTTAEASVETTPPSPSLGVLKAPIDYRLIIAGVVVLLVAAALMYPRKLYRSSGPPVGFHMITSGELSQSEKSIRFKHAALREFLTQARFTEVVSEEGGTTDSVFHGNYAALTNVEVRVLLTVERSQDRITLSVRSLSPYPQPHGASQDEADLREHLRALVRAEPPRPDKAASEPSQTGEDPFAKYR